jgi:hypothetical protein
MENEVLERIRKEYNDITGSIDSNFRELSRLEDNAIVKRYNYLKKLKDMTSIGELKNHKSVLDHCIEEHGYGKARQTNEIWLFMFECPIEAFEKRFNVRLLEQDKSKIVAYYTDLENKSKHAIVLKEKQIEFESTHRVVTGKNDIYDYLDRYYNIRHEFFVSCVEEGQDKAVEMILQKYPKR